MVPLVKKIAWLAHVHMCVKQAEPRFTLERERERESSVTRKKSPNVNKSCPTMISLEKL